MQIEDERRLREPNIVAAQEKAWRYMAEDDPVKRIVLRDLIELGQADFQIRTTQVLTRDNHNAHQLKAEILKRIESNHKLPGYNLRKGEIEGLIRGLEKAMTLDWGTPEEVNGPYVKPGQDVSHRDGAIRIFPNGPINL